MKLKNTFPFRLRFITAPEVGGGTSGPTPTPAPAPAFPADTDPADMTPEERAAYWQADAEKWKGLSRKHEKRARPADFDDVTADAEKWRQQVAANLTPDQKAVETAREEARRDAVGPFLHDAVRAELKAQRPHMTTEELDEFLEDVALTNFLDGNGRLDTDRVERLAGKLAAAPEEGGGTPPEPKPASGSALLGAVLTHTSAPPQGNAGSVDDHRARELARYAAKNTK